MALVPSLTFAGNAQEALEFYRAALGGELTLNRFADAPADCGVPEHWAEKIMYGHLQTRCGIRVSAMDAPPGCFDLTPNSNNVALHVEAPDAQAVREIVSKLSEGGNVTMPVERTFFSDAFGMVADKFGIRWMIGVPQAACAKVPQPA